MPFGVAWSGGNSDNMTTSYWAAKRRNAPSAIWNEWKA